MNKIHESACQFLFGKEANEIFGTSSFTEEFVNESIETLIKANVVFLSRKEHDGFSLLDTAAFNNQCHIYGLFSARIKRGYPQKSTEEKFARNQENRYLHLAFLLSFTFLTDRNLLCQTLESAASRKEIVLPGDKKSFFNFVKDSDGILVRTARRSFNEVFERSIKDALAEAKERSFLHRELYKLSLEELRYKPLRGNEPLYTLPKLAGVAYLIHEKIAFVIKAKVITEKGTGTLFYQSCPIKDKEPVLIFEVVASDHLSIDTFRKMAECCPSYFQRKPSRKNRHSANEQCKFCNPVQAELGDFKKAFDRATASMNETFYALAADFIREIQNPFENFFHDKEKYPLLTEIFQKAVPVISELGLSMRKPLAFTVDHVHIDSGKSALSPSLRMNSSPEAYLKERGYL